jgi:predicted DNA-binding protein (MmcQ/YjbR family)
MSLVITPTTAQLLKELVDHSYELVKSGLPKQQKKELEGL